VLIATRRTGTRNYAAALQSGKHVTAKRPGGSIEDAREIALAAKAAPNSSSSPDAIAFRSSAAVSAAVHPLRRARPAGNGPRSVAPEDKLARHIAESRTREGPELASRQDDSPGLIGKLACTNWTRPGGSSCPPVRYRFRHNCLVKDGGTCPTRFRRCWNTRAGPMFTTGRSPIRLRRIRRLLRQLCGDHAAGEQGWMFKEVDSPLLAGGLRAQGRLLQGNRHRPRSGRHQARAQGDKPAPELRPIRRTIMPRSVPQKLPRSQRAVEDFVSVFGADDPKALADHVAQVPRLPAAGYARASSHVTALKANEAVMSGERLFSGRNGMNWVPESRRP